MIRTTAWLRPLSEVPDASASYEVRGSRSRTRQDLFTEWAAGLREAADLLADAPPHRRTRCPSSCPF
ncbi:hypothetical protein [Streptomyces cellostaticus]|nr:hypothetical protein [Streptomyces cellostaticus]